MATHRDTHTVPPMLSTAGSPRAAGPSSAASARAALPLLVLLVSGMLAGCASDPAPTLLALPPLAPPPAATTPAAPTSAASRLPAAARVLLLRRTAIPEYIASRRVRYWSDASTLQEWPDTYWAERVEISIARELLAALRLALPGWTVCDNACSDRTPQYTLRIDLQRVDFMRPQARLLSDVQISLGAGTATAQPETMQRFELPVRGDSAQGQAQAMSELLRAVAQAAAGATTARAGRAP